MKYVCREGRSLVVSFDDGALFSRIQEKVNEHCKLFVLCICENARFR